MLKETHLNKVFYETWGVEHIHRIGLSLHEIEQILHALKHDTGFKGVDRGYHGIADRLRRMQERIIVKHELESLKI